MVRSSGRSNLEVGELAGAPSTVSCLLLAAGAQKYRPLRPSALTSPLSSTTGPLETAVIDNIAVSVILIRLLQHVLSP